MRKKDDHLAEKLSRAGQLLKPADSPAFRAQNPLVLVVLGVVMIVALVLIRRLFPTMHLVTFRLIITSLFLLWILAIWAWLRIRRRM